MRIIFAPFCHAGMAKAGCEARFFALERRKREKNSGCKFDFVDKTNVFARKNTPYDLAISTISLCD